MSETEPVQPNPTATGNGESSKSSRPKPAKTLPTDRIRFDKQLDILRAFAAASGHERKAVTGKDVGGIVDMADSTIAQITPFFVDVGLITREKKADSKGFVPSAEVVAYQKAYEWDKANAAKKLAPLLTGTWFTDALMPKLKFRAVNEKEAINDLGEIAAVGPDKEIGLKTIIDYLVAAGVVERDAGGMLRAASSSVEPPAEVAGTPKATPVTAPTVPQPKPSNVSDHQLWLLEILNAYPDLEDEDQDAILKLIKKIKGAAKKTASPAANE